MNYIIVGLQQQLKKYDYILFSVRKISVVDFDEERAIVLENDTSGFMYRLNYPLPMHFPKLRYKQRLLTSIGHNIQLQFNRVVPAQSKSFKK